MITIVVTMASDYTYRDIKHFETLDDLVTFMKNNDSLILSKNNPTRANQP